MQAEVNKNQQKQQKQQKQEQIDENNEKNETICIIPKQKKIKKLSLLKRKNQFVPIYNSPIVKQLFMLGDISLINQDSVRDPQNSRQSFIVNGLQFSKITSINLNKQFFAMNVKRNQGNYLTAQYFLDRFRSFGNRQLKQFADDISYILDECALVQKNILKTQQQIGRQIFWQKLNKIKQRRYQRFQRLICTKFKDKKYIVLYYSDGSKGLGLDKIIISNQMLKETGLKASQLINQYTKEKKLFFQLMGTGAYKDIFATGAKKSADAMKQVRLKNTSVLDTDPDQNVMSDFYIDLNTQIYRKRHNGQVQWQQKVKCPMKLFKPKPYISIFLFDDAQQKPIAIMNQKTKKIEMLQFQPKPTYEEQMKKIEIQNPSFVGQDNQKQQ